MVAVRGLGGRERRAAGALAARAPAAAAARENPGGSNARPTKSQVTGGSQDSLPPPGTKSC